MPRDDCAPLRPQRCWYSRLNRGTFSKVHRRRHLERCLAACRRSISRASSSSNLLIQRISMKVVLTVMPPTRFEDNWNSHRVPRYRSANGPIPVIAVGCLLPAIRRPEAAGLQPAHNRTSIATPWRTSTRQLQLQASRRRQCESRIRSPFKHLKVMPKRTKSSDDVFRTFSVRPSHEEPKSLILWRTRQDSNLWPLPSEGSALSS